MTTADTAANADAWVKFLSQRPEFPAGNRLLRAWEAGQLTRLCHCGAGCQSFDVKVPNDTDVEPLIRAAGSGGAIFMMTFSVTAPDASPGQGLLQFVVFADQRGHFDGMDVMYCVGAYPMPRHLIFTEPPVEVEGALLSDA